jgi:8-oxo-dGTP pyrophosphatase MutT (NUDIX family)
MVKHPPRAPKPAPKASAKLSFTEPDLIMLLADPEVRLLMRADNVDETELSIMLKTVSVQLRKDLPKDRRGPGYRVQAPELRKYRPGVGIILLNQQGQVFIARRNDVPGDAWQMPQGGIERNERPEQAAYRELKEEIGTDNADMLAESSGWFFYELPGDLAKRAWRGRWKGQRQKWFVMRFRGVDTDINLATDHPEFDAWRWATVSELDTLAVSFKKKLYVALLEEFAPLLGKKSR